MDSQKDRSREYKGLQNVGGIGLDGRSEELGKGERGEDHHSQGRQRRRDAGSIGKEAEERRRQRARADANGVEQAVDARAPFRPNQLGDGAVQHGRGSVECDAQDGQERRPDSEYASLRQCEHEVRKVEAMFRHEGIPFINTSAMSVEEIATTIIQHKNLQRRWFG